jgi:hypothetical protein
MKTFVWNLPQAGYRDGVEWTEGGQRQGCVFISTVLGRDLRPSQVLARRSLVFPHQTSTLAYLRTQRKELDALLQYCFAIDEIYQDIRVQHQNATQSVLLLNAPEIQNPPSV